MTKRLTSIISNYIFIQIAQKIIDECEGEVWLESTFGDKYNLKSMLSQYVAIGELISQRGEDLELFARNQNDTMKLIDFLSKHSDLA